MKRLDNRRIGTSNNLFGERWATTLYRAPIKSSIRSSAGTMSAHSTEDECTETVWLIGKSYSTAMRSIVMTRSENGDFMPVIELFNTEFHSNTTSKHHTELRRGRDKLLNHITWIDGMPDNLKIPSMPAKHLSHSAGFRLGNAEFFCDAIHDRTKKAMRRRAKAYRDIDLASLRHMLWELSVWIDLFDIGRSISGYDAAMEQAAIALMVHA